ncbi:MAG: hypothetical protein ACHQRM_15065 [Bacteroidia bacterium]
MIKKHFPAYCILFILLLCTWFMVTERWNGHGGAYWKEQLNTSDAKGYYAYLPECFLKQDLSDQDPEQVYVNQTRYGKGVNKYFIGNALCWSPFFGGAVAYTHLSGEESDGYTEAFKKSISIAALFWLGIGLFCLAEVFKMLGIGEIIAGITLLLITLGTNLFYYATLQPTMSHLYSFTMLCALLCFGIKYFRTGKLLYQILFLLAFSMSMLIRPVNMIWIILLLPWLGGGFRPLWQRFFRGRALLFSVLIPALFIFLQCGAWYLQTDHWFVQTYAGEGFYFLHPELFQVLFEFRKGWFIYTPIAFLALAGLYPLFKKDTYAGICLFLALLVHTYLTASWWSWSFADSFGHRAFIDLYTLVAILLAYSLQFIPERIAVILPKLSRGLIRVVFIGIGGLLLALNLVQTYQAEVEILHQNSMDWERYQYIFLKTGDRYIHCLGGNSDLMPYTSSDPEVIYSVDTDFSRPLAGWTIMEAKPSSLTGNKPALHFKGNEFGVTFELPSSPDLSTCQKLFAHISITRYEPVANSSSGCLLVKDILDPQNKSEYYYAFRINNTPSSTDGNLRTFQYDEEIPCFKNPGSKLRIYLWNQQKQEFYITHMKVEILRIAPDPLP